MLFQTCQIASKRNEQNVITCLMKNLSTFEFYRALFNTITRGVKTGKSLSTKQCFSLLNSFVAGKQQNIWNQLPQHVDTGPYVPMELVIYIFCTNFWVLILLYFYLGLNLGAIPRMGCNYPFWFVYFIFFMCVCVCCIINSYIYCKRSTH